MKRCLFVMLLCAALALVQPFVGSALGKSAVTVLKIKIEAPELDKRILLHNLQEHGTDNGLKFESVDQDFDYRIVFSADQQPVMTTWGSLNASTASADVWDSEGKELFKFNRQGRSTDEEATDAVAKEIIKRLLEVRNPSNVDGKGTVDGAEKIKIEAPELDKRILLHKLQEHGTDNGLKFESVDQDFDYRIVFTTGQAPVATQYGDINASLASADVYDSEGKELFKFNRQGRWTDEGATDAVAKEIIKEALNVRRESRCFSAGYSPARELVRSTR